MTNTQKSEGYRVLQVIDIRGFMVMNNTHVRRRKERKNRIKMKGAPEPITAPTRSKPHNKINYYYYYYTKKDQSTTTYYYYLLRDIFWTMYLLSHHRGGYMIYR